MFPTCPGATSGKLLAITWQTRERPLTANTSEANQGLTKKWAARWVPSSFFAIPFGLEVQPEWLSHNYFQKQTEHLAISPTSRTSRKHSAPEYKKNHISAPCDNLHTTRPSARISRPYASWPPYRAHGTYARADATHASDVLAAARRRELWQ